MFNQNGGKLHRTAGNIYFWSMMVIVCSSLYMSVYKDNIFLLMIGLFTFQLISTGVRALKLKKLHIGQKAEKIDWLILGISALSGIALAGWGIYAVAVMKNSFGITGIVFGFIMLRGVLRDYKRFTVPPAQKNHWLFIHIGNMIGGYIATFTAFLVQNVHTNPAFIAWLAPTIVFVPFLFYTIGKFKGRNKKEENLKLETRY